MSGLYKKIDAVRTGLFVALCAMVLAAGIFKVGSSYENSKAIFWYELLFVAAYFFSLKSNAWVIDRIRSYKYITILLLILYFSLSYYCYLFNYLGFYDGLFLTLFLFVILLKSGEPFASLAIENRLVASLMALWLVGMTISYYWSPLDVSDTSLGRLRFRQTMLHVVFFLVLFDYLRKYRPPVAYVLTMIPISALIIGMGFLAIYLNTASGEIADNQWFVDPPFQAHIRHVGYQVTAGLAVLLPYLLYWRRLSTLRVVQYFSAVFLWAFLFWCGGRASFMAIFLVTFWLWSLLWRSRSAGMTFLLTTAVVLIAAIFLSHWVSVFSWNGLLQGLTRSIDALNTNGPGSGSSVSLPHLTTGRTSLWQTTMDALNGHVFFGMGPQSYYYIYGKSTGTIQPHSMLVQFLVEWGLFGSVLFVMLIATAFFKGLKQHVIGVSGNYDPNMLAAGCIIASLTAHGLTDGTYYHPQPSLYLAIGYAIWLLPRKAGVGISAQKDESPVSA